VQVAVAAARPLEPALSVRVVSMPRRESFAAQPDAIRDAIVPRQARSPSSKPASGKDA
jgi:transketolase